MDKSIYNCTNLSEQGFDMKNNLVAKYARQFNKCSIERDRKKLSKDGYKKHKRETIDE